jgi:FAD/FMN-containing dehydrogenase
VAHLVSASGTAGNPDKFEWYINACSASINVDELRKITPNSGAYWNETDRYEPNWEESFWGKENYAKLKTIKQKYDPNGVF